MMFNPRQFALRLRKARKRAGLSMKRVHELVYVSQSVICRYEKGSTFPPVERLYDLAKLYGVSMDWLCGMEDEN